jgi:predicted DNA-binding transcriptional regulator AlpA
VTFEVTTMGNKTSGARKKKGTVRKKTSGVNGCVGARKILRRNQTVEKTGMSWSTIRRMELNGIFPQRVRVGLRGVGHIESEIDGYLASLERVPPAAQEDM